VKRLDFDYLRNHSFEITGSILATIEAPACLSPTVWGMTLAPLLDAAQAEFLR
jgi:hypothetical protein